MSTGLKDAFTRNTGVGYVTTPSVTAAQYGAGFSTSSQTIDLNKSSGWQALTNMGGQEHTEPQGTMLEALAPGEDFSVKVTGGIGQYAVKQNPTSTIAGSTVVAKNQPIVDNIKADVKETKDQISGTIREAQDQVREICKDIGYNPDQVFPDMRMAKGGELGLAVGAVTPAPGPVNMALNMDAVLTDMNGINPKKRGEIIDQIKQTIIARAESPETKAMQSFNRAASPQQEDKKPKVDLANFVKQNHSIAALMSLDPDNPNPEMVPEWEALTMQEAEIAEVEQSFEDVLTHKQGVGEVQLALKNNDMKTVEQIVGKETFSAAMQAEEPTATAAILLKQNPIETKSTVELTSGFISTMATFDIAGLKPSLKDAGELTKTAKDMAPALDLEFDPAKLAPEHKQDMALRT